jgi:serine/threonine protein kinase
LRQLGTLHDKYGITHRDIKPSNLMVSVQGDTRILDPGLAYQEGMARLTQTGQILGTPGYVAPDQARSSKDATTAKSDLYSLGCTLLELATGDPIMRTKRVVAHLITISDRKSLLRQCRRQLEQVADRNPQLAEAIRSMLLGSKDISELIELLYSGSVFDDGGHFANADTFRTAPASDSHLRLELPAVDESSANPIEPNSNSLHSHVTSSELYRETKQRARIMGMRKRTVAMIVTALGITVVFTSRMA